MAIKITDECINCGACEPECPNNAIYEGAMEWRLSDGTALKGNVTTYSGFSIDANSEQAPKEDDIFFIVRDKCTECVGFYEEPQCAAVCPVDCCVPDENHVESKEILLEKKNFLHNSI
ncbi:MAG: 4Fe-4S binding protein [Flavobacteriales bacterium Tduv]